MTAINAQDVKDLRKTRRELLDLKGWLLLEKLAAWGKGNPPTCNSSVAALRNTFGWARNGIMARLDQLERLNLLHRKRRRHDTTLFTVTLFRLRDRPNPELPFDQNESPPRDFDNDYQSPGESPPRDKNHTREKPRARARGGAAATPATGATAPVGSARARTPPATQHTPLTPRVEDARPRKPASLRSGDGAPAYAPRATPAPARAQSFDIEAWTPTPEQRAQLQAVRPDLDAEIVAEQVVAFRVWARSQDHPPKFRDAAECMRKLASFLRQTYAPRSKRSPPQPLAGARHEHEGSARHEGRASTAKAKGEAKGKSRGKARAQRVGPRPIPENLNLFRSCLRKGLAKEGRDVPPGVKAVAVEALRPLYVGSGLTSRHFDKQLTRALRFGAAMLVDIDGTPMLCEPRRDGEAG